LISVNGIKTVVANVLTLQCSQSAQSAKSHWRVSFGEYGKALTDQFVDQSLRSIGKITLVHSQLGISDILLLEACTSRSTEDNYEGGSDQDIGTTG
jgi:hypothetical protein